MAFLPLAQGIDPAPHQRQKSNESGCQRTRQLLHGSPGIQARFLSKNQGNLRVEVLVNNLQGVGNLSSPISLGNISPTCFIGELEQLIFWGCSC
jgi:hypothetical protein